MASYAGKYGPNHLWGQDATTSRLIVPTSVQIVVSGTSTAATLYAARTMDTTAANPVTTNAAFPVPGLDSSGNLTFFADVSNEYDAVATLPGGSVQKVQGLRVIPDSEDLGNGDVWA